MEGEEKLASPFEGELSLRYRPGAMLRKPGSQYVRTVKQLWSERVKKPPPPVATGLAMTPRDKSHDVQRLCVAFRHPTGKPSPSGTL